MTNELKTNWVKAAICFVLIGISVTILFLPIEEGAEAVRGMFILLTGIAVRDFFGGVQQDKNIEAIKQAYNPAPPEPYFDEENVRHVPGA